MIEVKINKEDVNRVINKLREISPERRGGVAHRAFVDATAYLEQKLKLNISGRILKVRSGRLRSSIGSLVMERMGELQGLVGSGVRQGNRVVYANIHETGGVITQKRVKWLTIPLQAALTPAGVPRGKARDFENTFFAWSKAGNLILFQRSGNDVIPLFVLKKQVRIPARRYMSITAEECAGQIADIMVNRIVKEFNQ